MRLTLHRARRVILTGLILGTVLAVLAVTPVGATYTNTSSSSSSTSASSANTTTLSVAGTGTNESVKATYTVKGTTQARYGWRYVDNWLTFYNRTIVPDLSARVYLTAMAYAAGLSQTGAIGATPVGGILPTNAALSLALAGGLPGGTGLDFFCNYPAAVTPQNASIASYGSDRVVSPDGAQSVWRPRFRYCYTPTAATWVNIACAQAFGVSWDPFGMCSSPNSGVFAVRSYARPAGPIAPEITVGKGLPAVAGVVCPWLPAGYYQTHCWAQGPPIPFVANSGLVPWTQVAVGTSYASCATSWHYGCGFDSSALGLHSHAPSNGLFYPLHQARYGPNDLTGWPELDASNEQWYYGANYAATWLNGTPNRPSACPTTATNSLGQSYTPVWAGASNPNWCWLQLGAADATTTVYTATVTYTCYAPTAAVTDPLKPTSLGTQNVSLPDGTLPTSLVLSTSAIGGGPSGNLPTASLTGDTQGLGTAVTLDPTVCGTSPLRPS